MGQLHATSFPSFFHFIFPMLIPSFVAFLVSLYLPFSFFLSFLPPLEFFPYTVFDQHRLIFLMSCIPRFIPGPWMPYVTMQHHLCLLTEMLSTHFLCLSSTHPSILFSHPLQITFPTENRAEYRHLVLTIIIINPLKSHLIMKVLNSRKYLEGKCRKNVLKMLNTIVLYVSLPACL